MDGSASVLVVDDEASIREPLAKYLNSAGLDARTAVNAAEARQILLTRTFDLIVLDVMMPGEDGLSLCRHIRESHDTPVVMLTARAEDTDRIVGLEIGADDYVAKPFNPRELLARIRAILRRASSPSSKRTATFTSLAFGGWVLKTDERILIDANGVATALSTGEYNLLFELLQRPGTVLSRETLLGLSRGREADIFDRSIDNMISRIRRKIEPDPKDPTFIKTIWGGGYMFSAEVRQA